MAANLVDVSDRVDASINVASPDMYLPQACYKAGLARDARADSKI